MENTPDNNKGYRNRHGHHKEGDTDIQCVFENKRRLRIIPEAESFLDIMGDTKDGEVPLVHDRIKEPVGCRTYYKENPCKRCREDGNSNPGNTGNYCGNKEGMGIRIR